MTDELIYDGSDDDTRELPAYPRDSAPPDSDRSDARVRSISNIISAAASDHRRLEGLMDVARRLAGATDLDALLPIIIEEASRSMSVDRASIFLCDYVNNTLYSRVAKGLETDEIRFPINQGIAGFVALTGQVLNLTDAYADHRFNLDIDRQTGFKTREILTVPLRDRRDVVIGVLQALNRRPPGPFTPDDISFMEALAGIVAVSIENVSLYEELNATLESLVIAASQTIDDRDPVTRGHSDRVTRYALALALAVHRSSSPAFADIEFTRKRIQRLRYAGQLHDWGKISTSTDVLTKMRRLPRNGIEILTERIKRRAAEFAIETFRRCASGEISQADAELEVQAKSTDSEALCRYIDAMDSAPFINDDDARRIESLRSQLTESEMECLSVRRGNLTADEWKEMRSHAEKTLRFLERIRWSPEMKDLPAIAAAHHERADGKGYPLGLAADAIPFDGKILAIADVYDALTAHDRPYKPAIPHDRAQAIMRTMTADGHLDASLTDLFFAESCWKLQNDKS
ncbi:MAG: HD domain-containing phosphohydrolase [Planctomycetota bacterium]